MGVAERLPTLTNVVDRDARVATLRAGWDYAPPGSALIDLSALVYFDDTRIEEDRNFDGRADRTDYRTFGAEIVNRSRFDVGLPTTLVYGVEAYRDTQEGRRDGAARPEFPDASVTFYAAFAEATVALSDTLDLIPGVRVDRYDLDPDSAAFSSRSDTEVSPRIALSWRPVDGLQLFGSVARAFRAPSLTELYTDGVHFSTPGFPLGPGTVFGGVNSFVPNPDLKAETAIQYEFCARYEARDVARARDRLSLAVNAYYADVNDFVDSRVTFIDFDTATFAPGTGLVVGRTTRTENVDARLWGFEAEAAYDAGPWFASLSGMIPRGENRSGGPLGSIPQDRLNLGLGWRPAPGVTLGARGTFARGQSRVPEGGRESDGFSVVDLFASYAPESGPLAGAVFRAGVDNLFDRDHRIHPNGLDQPGRSFKISAAFTF